jgi:hypothetical protein
MIAYLSFFGPMVSYLIIYKNTTKHNEIQEKAWQIRAGMCTEWKLHSNWCSSADTPSLSPPVVAGLRVCYSRHCSSPETFFVWKICSWTNLFVMKGVNEPRFHCIYTLSIMAEVKRDVILLLHCIRTCFVPSNFFGENHSRSEGGLKSFASSWI